MADAEFATLLNELSTHKQAVARTVQWMTNHDEQHVVGAIESLRSVRRRGFRAPPFFLGWLARVVRTKRCCRSRFCNAYSSARVQTLCCESWRAAHISGRGVDAAPTCFFRCVCVCWRSLPLLRRRRS
jgi:hypothetical protein